MSAAPDALRPVSAFEQQLVAWAVEVSTQQQDRPPEIRGQTEHADEA